MPKISTLRTVTAPISFRAYLQLIREQASLLSQEVTKIHTESILERENIYTMDIDQMIQRLIMIRIEMIKIQKQLRAYRAHIAQITLSNIGDISSALDDIGEPFILNIRAMDLSLTYREIRKHIDIELASRIQI